MTAVLTRSVTAAATENMNGRIHSGAATTSDRSRRAPKIHFAMLGELRQRKRIAVGIFEPRHLGAVGRGPHAELVLLDEADPQKLHAA